MRSSKLTEKKEFTISCKLTKDEFEYINLYCVKSHISPSQFIRMVIDNLIIRETVKKPN